VTICCLLLSLAQNELVLVGVLDCIFDTVSTLLKGQVGLSFVVLYPSPHLEQRIRLLRTALPLSLYIFPFLSLHVAASRVGGQADDVGQPGADPAHHRRGGE
jgi:hypothetical protein